MQVAPDIFQNYFCHALNKMSGKWQSESIENLLGASEPEAKLEKHKHLKMRSNTRKMQTNMSAQKDNKIQERLSIRPMPVSICCKQKHMNSTVEFIRHVLPPACCIPHLSGVDIFLLLWTCLTQTISCCVHHMWKANNGKLAPGVSCLKCNTAMHWMQNAK